MRRLLVAVLVTLCAAGVIGYQVTRPARAPASPHVFVPAARLYQDFSPSYRTSIADAYFLYVVQYYGEHMTGDKRLDSLAPLLDVVTRLSPHFERAYLFGAFALIDAGRPDLGYALLQRGYTANPGDWRYPAMLAFFAYRYGKGADKDRVAASWYEKAAAIPGRPDYIPRLAAALLSRGGETQKAILMWGQVYASGDKYVREKAVTGLDKLLPAAKGPRMKALAPLYVTMPKAEFDQLIAALFPGG